MASIEPLNFNSHAVHLAISNTPGVGRVSINFNRIIPVGDRINFRPYRAAMSGIIFI